MILTGHTEKIYSIKFHPLASDVLASSSYDHSVRIWDVQSRKEAIRLEGHTEQIFSLAWSPNGQQLATACKDGRLRIYDPRSSTQPCQEGSGPPGTRGARVVWVCDGECLLVSGFDSAGERLVSLHRAADLAGGALASINIVTSPSTLIPHYDPDTGVVFLTGKGDTRVFVYEVVPQAPYFLECLGFSSLEPHKVGIRI
uniref:Coronin n=1 Tax=Eptatretus burgeri TaxID=7764 RepID=A0A8C4Q545_EPTBU